MRLFVRYVSLLILLLVVTLSCFAQDAAKIVAQYVKAAGGSKALSRVQTYSLDGVIQSTEQAKPETYSLRVKLPNRYYTELQNNGRNLIVAYNGKSAWQQNDAGEISTLQGPQALEIEAAAQYYNSRWLGLSKKKVGAAFKGAVPLRGRQTFQIELTFPTGIQWEVFFDQQSHLIVSEKATIAGTPCDIDYDDYRALNGLKVPYHLEIHRGSESFIVNATRVATNETIGERVFDFPMKSQVKLPDLKKLFEEVDANQKQIDKIKENYAGTQTEEETEYDKTGKVSKKESKKSTFFYLNGEEVTTLVEKDGKSLDAEQQKKENDKTAKRIEALQKKQEKKDRKEEKTNEEGKESKNNDDPGIEVFLRVSQFVNPRRERFRGQDVLVFDFEPNPEYKPKKLEERVVKQLAGVVWIDEKAKDVVRLEAYFVGDVHLGAGLLANLQKGTSFVFEQAFVNNEVWLPTYMEAHVGARVLLVKAFKVNFTVRYSDYKRFNVETLTTIHKPSESGAPGSKPNNP